MYCRECGEQITNEKAVICIKCGTGKGQGDKYCPECGVAVKTKGAEVCLNCGVRIKGSTNNFANQIKNVTNNSSSSNNDNKMVAGLLAIFLGGAGVHRFYLGYKQIGFIQLGIFAAGIIIFQPILLGSSIWAIFDAVQIFTGKLNNADGTELV